MYRKIAALFVGLLTVVITLLGSGTAQAYNNPGVVRIVVSSTSQSGVYTQFMPGPSYYTVPIGACYGEECGGTQEPTEFYTGTGWCTEWWVNNGTHEYANGMSGGVWTGVNPSAYLNPGGFYGTWTVHVQSWQDCWG